MAPKWLKILLGENMPPPAPDTAVTRALDEHRRNAEQANIKGDESLTEIRQIRAESREVNRKVKKTLQENHFADLMMRALEPR